MPSGITGATITTLTNGTTASAADVMASLNSIKSNGVNNDAGAITTDNSGGITATKFSTGNGQVRGLFMMATPYHLTTNPTVNSGNTTNLTCTGGATGVPTGATAVLLSLGIFAVNVQGGYVQIYPTGATAGQYANFTANGPTNTFSATAVIVPVSAGGQITVKANSSNIVLQDWYIFGYVI